MRALVAIPVIVCAALATPATTPAQARDPAPGPDGSACATAWDVVFSPNRGGRNNALSGLAALSRTDVWAVGNSEKDNARRTLAAHWDGTGWTLVPTPNRSPSLNYLIGADAASSADVWAVGFFEQDDRNKVLVERWDGAAWSIMPGANPTFPSPYPVSNELYKVAALSAGDAWAVGRTYDLSQSRTLVEHWNGTAWRAVPSQRPGRFSALRDVSALAGDDVWAVGENYNDEGLQVTLIEHWDGNAWRRAPSPNVGPYHNELLGVDAVAPDDVWAVGYHLAVFGVSQVQQTSILHWDGAAWSVVPSPNVNQRNNYLFAVSGVSADDAWAVGFYDTGSELRTLTEHWDGATWSVVTSPNAGEAIDELYDVAVLGPEKAWAVGSFVKWPLLGIWATLAERLSCLR